jgi:hypothetical protein
LLGLAAHLLWALNASEAAEAKNLAKLRFLSVQSMAKALKPEHGLETLAN